jgi:dTDP-4-amino-4,6-dideoxygalactose transaminase
MLIPFNKPHLTGKETEYIKIAVESGKISGDGMFTEKCHSFFEQRYGFKKVLLTTSCTDALEMAAILVDIHDGDEVIVPSYTFVSTANAFVLRGAKIVFADSEELTPNIDVAKIESLISPRTKALVVVHYAGVSCDMDPILDIANKHHLFVIEDAAQAIDSFYKGKVLGSFGHMATFSFHETKNVSSGEGGMLVINDERFLKRAEIVREKGTNRSAFFRGEVDKYGWLDIGSSYLPSDIIAAYLYAQLENLEVIQAERKQLWRSYYEKLKPLEEKGLVKLPFIPRFATNNGHMFYMVCRTLDERSALLKDLNRNDVNAVSHYVALHKSPFWRDKHDGRELPNTDRYADGLVRLPMYYGLTNDDTRRVVDRVFEFYGRS